LDEDNFLGLVLDEDNDSMMSDERISNWVMQIRKELTLTESSGIAA
jgi:hypothetical protein